MSDPKGQNGIRESERERGRRELGEIEGNNDRMELGVCVRER